MNLYLVTCAYRPAMGRPDTLDVYVVAGSPTEAEDKALCLMKKLKYKYTDWVSEITLLASTGWNKAGDLLAL